MSCQCRYSHTYQNWSTGCCHDTVIGSGRYTHTKYDTAQHSQKQCNDQFSVCNTDDSVDQVIGKSCHGDGTGNDSCNTAGYCYGDNTSSSCFQRINTFGNTDSVFFVFYFGIVADNTPPVALAAYAGSAIAKANPMKTAFTASKLAIAVFIVPYVFCFNPAMLLIDTTPLKVVQIFIT